MSADDEARRTIAERLDATVLVEAGAGTGKTRALVERVVALVSAGVPIERIAAITFTERAAAELRDRVRAGLEEREAAAPDLLVAGRCRVALEGLDRAQLSTIHAFGQSLLRAFAAEAGVDPEFRVLDELAAQRRFEERWRAALEDMDPDGPGGLAVDRALGLGLTVDALRTLARELGERGDVAAVLRASPPSAPPPDWDRLAGMRAAIAALPLVRVHADDACLELLLRLAGLLDGLLAADGWERDVLLAGHPGLYDRRCGRLGNQANWGDRDAIAEARDVAAAVSAGLGEVLASARAEALAGVLPGLARLTVEDAERRRRDGTLVYTDLILWTRDLLRDVPQARAALRGRYDALLIDEFQDTDPWQVAIAESFARALDGRPMDPGRLFLVGDPKQSIYRFRRADMAVYAAERARVEGEGGLLPRLTVNRRSRAAVVDWVNAVFARLIGDGDDPSLQPPYAPIRAERAGPLEGPGVAWIGGPAPAPARAWQLRMTEGAEVAAVCRAAVEDGWEVQERDGTARRARLGDVAVLIPARTGLSALEGALRRAGVPYRVEGGSLVYRTQELRDLINCLTAIDDPSDEVAVVGALRSPAFACSDRELADHRRAGLRFDYLAPDAGGAGAVADALRRLRAHHEQRHDRSLASVVERVLADLRLVEVGLVAARSRDPYRRARFVVEQARAFERDRPQGLRAFVEWLEERTTAPALDPDGAGLDDDEDAVRVMTIHAAKGLEFPIAVLAGIGTRPQHAMAPVVSHDGGTTTVAIGAKTRGLRFELGDAAAAEARERAHAAAELARLLYVGATRARDHLVVSLHHLEGRAGGSGAVRLMEAGAHGLAARLEVPAGGGERAAAPLAGLAVDPAAATPEAHAAARAALVAGARRVRYTSATGIAAAARERGEEGEEPWGRGRGGTRVGRAVHAALQSLPLDAGAEAIAAVASAQAVAEAVPERAEEVAALVTAALGSDAAARARAATGALREVPFALARDGAVVEGFIDLVVPDAGGLEIVDWKTDDVDPGRVPERLAGYRLQAGLYALGLRAATGLPVTRITYVFVRAGVEESPGDPDALAESAAGGLSATGGS